MKENKDIEKDTDVESTDVIEEQQDSLMKRLIKTTWEIFRILVSIVIVILLMFLFFFTNESKTEKESKIESPSVLIKELQKDVDKTLENNTTNKHLLELVNQIQKTEKTLEKDSDKNPANKAKNQELLLKVRSMKDDIILKKLLDSEISEKEQKKGEKVEEKKTLF